MVSRYDFSRGVIKCHISREIWKVYRQALRDITIKYADPPLNEKGYMDNAKIDWPEKP